MMELLTLSYWFKLRPEPFGLLGQSILIIAFFVFLAGSIISWRYYQRKIPVYHKVWSAVFSLCLTNVIIAALWFFFDNQMVPILMTKIWYLLWLISLMIWIVMIIKRLKRVPVRQQELAQQKEFNKYLPK